jgi:hypothetical protein
MEAAPEPIELTLTVSPGLDPIRGSARLADGACQSFWGWLELTEIIQRAVDGSLDPRSPNDSPLS